MRDISAEGLAKKVKELKDYVDGLFLGATDGVVYDIAIGGSVGPVDDSTCRKIAEDLIDSRKNGMYGFDVIYAWVRASKILPDGDTEASYGGLVHKYLRHSPSGTRAEIDDDIYEDSDIGVHDLYPEAPDLDVLIAKGMEGAKEAYRKYADAIIAQVENDRIPELREAFKKAKQEHEGILAHERKLADDSDKYQARLKRGKYEGQGDPLQNPGRFEERRLENTKKAAVDILNGLRKDTELTFSRTDMGDDTIAGHLTLQQVEENLDGNLLYVGPTHMDISVSPEARLPAPSKDAILHIGYYDDDDYTTENEDGTFTFYEGNYRAYIGPYTSSLEVDLSKPDAVNKLRAYVSSVNKELESFQRKADAIVRSAQKYTRDVANNPRP